MKCKEEFIFRGLVKNIKIDVVTKGCQQMPYCKTTLVMAIFIRFQFNLRKAK